MAQALRHVGIVVSDIERATQVFHEYLGCDIVTQYGLLEGKYISKLLGLENARISVVVFKTRDSDLIEVIEYVSHPGIAKQPVLANTVGISHISLTVDDIQDLYNRRVQYNVKFLSPPLDSPNDNVKVAYAIVLEEFIIELVEELSG